MLKKLEYLQGSSKAFLLSGVITAFVCAIAACGIAIYLLLTGTDFLLHAILTQMIYSTMQVLLLVVMITLIIEMNCSLKCR